MGECPRARCRAGGMEAARGQPRVRGWQGQLTKTTPIAPCRHLNNKLSQERIAEIVTQARACVAQLLTWELAAPGLRWHPCPDASLCPAAVY